MSVVTFGFGDTSARVVTLGFGGGAAAQSGSYVTLGYGESASRAAMLGLSPSAAAGFVGSYITFGQGQSASLFLRLGLHIGDEGSPVQPPIPPEIVTVAGGGYQFYFPRVDLGARIKRDDDDIIALIMSMIQTGIIH